MKQILLSTLLAGLMGLACPPGGRAQALAHHQTRQRPAQETPAAPMKLRDALMQLKRQHGVDILFEEKLLDGMTVPATTPLDNASVERNLTTRLRPSGLRFKRVRRDAYVILAPTVAPKTSFRTGESPAELVEEGPQPTVEANLMATLTTVQERVVTGTVATETDDGMPGVSVVVKGSTRGTTTDAAGRYRLNAPSDGGLLVFSFVGYVTREVAIGNQAVVDVRLSPDNKTLNEVVVVGYGAVKRSDLTGSVASVGERDIKATPVLAVDRALQGRAAGVQVTSNSARPGGGVTIRIRGTGSVNATNEPLYVIDGYPTGDLNSINPNDIESVEILKDASATAIYGSRGSNGVVLVTTKRGTVGQSTVSFESYYGVQEARRTIPLLNAREYAEFLNEARINGGGTAYFDGSSPDRPCPAHSAKAPTGSKPCCGRPPFKATSCRFRAGKPKPATPFRAVISTSGVSC